MYVGENSVIGVALGSQVGHKLILGGAILWGDQYSITKTLTNAVIDNNAASVYYKEPYVATLSGEDGMQIIPSYVKITMGGTDITSTAYNSENNIITIEKVTGNITISAEAAAISADYKPVEYIEVTTKSASNSIVTNYTPNYKTKLVLDVNPIEGYPNLLYGTVNPNLTASATNPAFHAWIKITNTAGGVQFGTISRAASSNLRLQTGKRVFFTCDKGKFTFTRYGGSVLTYNYSDPSEWTAKSYLRIFGTTFTGASYWGSGKIYRATISEEGTTLRDYVPVKRLSDGVAGLYDTINGAYISASAYSYPT